MLTGKWPTEHLCIANWDAEAPRPHVEGLPVYSRMLHDAGYRLGYADKWHVHRDRGPGDYGFDEVTETWGYVQWREARGIPPQPRERGWYGEVDPHITPRQSRLGYAADHVIGMLKRRAEDDAPFCVVWSPPAPHMPSRPPREYAEMYPPDAIPKWPGFDDPLEGKPCAQAQQRHDWGVADWQWSEDWAPSIARYFAVVSLLDAQVGRVLDAVDRFGLADSTLVVYTADHGDTVGEHRMVDQHFILYDCVVRVPLIARLPGTIQPGTVCDEFVCNALDLSPTFLDLAGIPVPGTFRGESLLPVLRGEKGVGRKDVFSMYFGNQFGLYSMRMVRDGRWKYIWNATAEDELYDLKADPGEVRNLAGAAENADELARLRRRLVAWMEETSDLLCNQWTRKSLLEGRTQ
jgi:arylsulfatase A-like enzyme